MTGRGTPVANLLVPALGSTPTAATAANASPTTVAGTTTNLSVLGASTGWGESSLTYTWSATTLPAGAATPTFSANGTNAAKNTTATFHKAGSYAFRVTITNTPGAWVTSTVNVTVNQTATTTTVTPPTGQGSVINVGATVQFTATATDQFGNGMTTPPTFTWTTTDGLGTISASGLFAAPYSIGPSPHTAADTVSGTVTAKVDDSTTGTYNVTVTNSVTLSSGAMIEVDSGTRLTLHSIVFGSGGGTVLVNGGILVLAGITLSSGGTFEVENGGRTKMTSLLTDTTGTVTVNGGTLALSNLTGTAAVTLDGGTLEADAPFSSATPITIGAGGGTVNTNGWNVTLGGNISDDPSVRHRNTPAR